MGETRFRPSALILLAAVVACADARSEAPPPELTVANFERLSFDLRAKRLDDTERAAVSEVLAKRDDKAARALYDKQVDAWLTKDALKSYVAAFLKFPPVAVVNPDGEMFFQRLAKSGDAYYLPHHETCAAGAATSVQPWWSKTPIQICASSYVPDKIFDAVGYCSGESEPLMRQPPRPECGCGPMLMGCLPPAGENAALDKLVKTSVADEWFETAARIVAEDKPLDQLVTTSETWQNGFAELMYARREAIAEHKKSGWSPAVAKRIEDRFNKIDVFREGRWVKRTGIYDGSGLWWTSLAVAALKIPVRPAAHHLLDRHLCMPFGSVGVDADSVLKAVGDKQENLRTLSSLTAAPMRFQEGCKGCHAPMDGAAGFMGDIQGPLYGSYVTGQKSEGEFFVAGGHDFRGKGTGTAALAKFVIKAAEFEPCSVRRAFEQVFQRPVISADQPLMQKLVGEFKKNGHKWRPVIRALLVSDAYLRQAAPAPAPVADPAKEVPQPVAKLIAASCTRCHDGKRNKLDLTKLPEPSDIAMWKKIHTRVSDSSMPPPKTEEGIVERFPLDPADRRALVQNIGKMLGSAIDPPQPPRRIAHPVWVSIVRDVAQASIGPDKVAALLGKIDTAFQKLPPRGMPPAYVLAVEQASEAACHEVAVSATNTYGLTAGEWTADAKAERVRKLLAAIYGSAPADVAADVVLLDKLKAETGDWREAWSALCSTHLSGPKLLFGSYTGKDAR